MKRDDLIGKLEKTTQDYLEKYQKNNPEAVKKLKLHQRANRLFSRHGRPGYVRAEDFLKKLAGFQDDNAALVYIYNQISVTGTNFNQSNELKRDILKVCAEHIKATDTSLEAVGYAIVQRFTGKAEDQIKKHLEAQINFRPFRDLGLNASPYSAISKKILMQTALSNYINELSNNTYMKIQIRQSSNSDL